jgi:hypothetical protein
MQSLYCMFFMFLHCNKRVTIFPSPAGMSLTKLFLAGNNLITTGKPLFTVHFFSFMRFNWGKPIFWIVLKCMRVKLGLFSKLHIYIYKLLFFIFLYTVGKITKRVYYPIKYWSIFTPPPQFTLQKILASFLYTRRKLIYKIINVWTAPSWSSVKWMKI